MSMPLSRWFTVAFCAVLLIAPAAHAWGPEGHRIVADLAQRHLSPAAEAQVEHLLSAEHTTRLADVASWADELRHDPARQDLWKRTRALHYINFRDPRCHYLPPRDCPDGHCVVAALAHYVQVLGDRRRSDAERLEALKFVVHLVGDVHQPLHAGYRDDKGGNDYQVQFQGKPMNLHRVWDSAMLSSRHPDEPAYVAELATRPSVTLPAPIPPYADPYAQWAEESCAATAQPGFYPDGHRIDAAYVDAHLPLAEQRLRLAGRRLAQVLNRTLAR